jgi:hypothetical protein
MMEITRSALPMPTEWHEVDLVGNGSDGLSRGRSSAPDFSERFDTLNETTSKIARVTGDVRQITTDFRLCERSVEVPT